MRLIHLRPITNIEIIVHEELLTMYSGVSNSFIKTMFLEEEVTSILEFTVCVSWFNTATYNQYRDPS